MEYNNLIIENHQAITTLWFNRPEVHNAFNEEMVSELIDALEKLKEDDTVRILILRGKGKSFCAGADLQWMKKAVDYSYEQNLEESLNLSQCLYDLYTFPKPTIAMAHGAIYGGGNGLAAACDFVIADEESVFALSEVKLGLIPSTISPYVLKRTGESIGKRLMLRGNRFSAREARIAGLADYYGPKIYLNELLEKVLEELQSSGPVALSETKKLVNAVVNHWSLDDAKQYTAEWIAKIRQSTEGQEGMKAFFEKRKPNWVK